MHDVNHSHVCACITLELQTALRNHSYNMYNQGGIISLHIWHHIHGTFHLNRKLKMHSRCVRVETKLLSVLFWSVVSFEIILRFWWWKCIFHQVNLPHVLASYRTTYKIRRPPMFLRRVRNNALVLTTMVYVYSMTDQTLSQVSLILQPQRLY